MKHWSWMGNSDYLTGLNVFNLCPFCVPNLEFDRKDRNRNRQIPLYASVNSAANERYVFVWCGGMNC